jgi:nucleotide-binding universal stress UspA family protein
MREVVLASDGSPGALKAARWLTRHLDATQYRVRVVTVAEPLPTGLAAISGYPMTVPTVDLEADQRRVFELTRQELQGFDIVETARQGDPVREILAVVREVRPELLVVGHRGLRGLEGLVMGSVAKALAANSPVPVVVVPLEASDV